MRRSFAYLIGIIFTLEILLPSINVQAQQRPRILEHPADAVAAREEPLTLNCKATGRPSPDIFWYHNGTPLVPSERRVILPEGSLFFLRVMHNKREQDAGVYWCEARSSAGIAISRNATLQIAVLKDDFRSVPKDTIALVGGPVILNCTPPRGVPEPSVLWYKDGRLLDLSGKRLSMVEGGSLMISEVQASDAGRYECSAQNMAGSKSAPPAVLKVLTPPTLVRGPQDTEVIEGEGLDIPCELIGDPKPIVSWHRDGGTLPEGRSRTLLDNTLRIEDARAEDQGQYICKGYNEGGNVSFSIKLSVYAMPTFIEAPTDAEVREGETITLPCRASGRPKTIIIWDKIKSPSGVIQVNEEISRLLDEEAREELVAKAKIMSFRSKRNHLDISTEIEDIKVNRTSRSVVIVDDDNSNNNNNNINNNNHNNNSNNNNNNKENDELNNNNELTSEASSFSTDVPSTLLPDLPTFEVNKNKELVIKDIKKKDEGWYACAALNEAGSVVKKIFIHVISPGDPGGEFQIPDSPGSRWGSQQNIIITSVKPISSHSIEVSWGLAQKNMIRSNIMTLYYRPISTTSGGNDVRILSKEYLSTTVSIDKKSFKLTDLKPHTIYEVFATIPVGFSSSVSNLRKGKTMDGPPSAPPTDVRVGVINNTAAYVRWSPPPSHLLNGELTGYKIQIKSNVTNKLLGQMSLNATTQSVVINSLSPGGRYIARVAPLTAGGLGPFSPPAPLHMDPAFIARPPKTDPTLNTWTISWMPGIALGILGVCLISGAIFAVFWARRNKRNLKASYPGPILTSSLPDKPHTLWLHGNTTIKPAQHSFAPPPIPSEYAEVTPVTAKINNTSSAPPEPYATVTLQRGGGGVGGGVGGCGSVCINGGGGGGGGTQSDDSCRKCSASPSSSEYNAPIRMPMNICEMLPPPPDHPYGSYKPPNNMTIRTNPAALSPQILRRVQPTPPRWDTLPPPPIPNFPQNWIQDRQDHHQHQHQHQQQQQQQQHHHHHHHPPPPPHSHSHSNPHSHPPPQSSQDKHNIYTENEYESGSVLYEQFCRENNDASYFNEGGEPTEEYYRNVNMEYFEDQEFEPSTPPPPCPDSCARLNSNLRLLAAANMNQDNPVVVPGVGVNQRRIFRNAAQHTRDNSCERNGGGGGGACGANSSDDSESGDNRWVPRARRSRSRSKSGERKYRSDQ